MTYEAFVILPTAPATTPQPEPPAEVEPPQHRGKTFDDLSPTQKSRLLRYEVKPFFYEPVYDENGETGTWRVGKAELHNEITISEFDKEDEAMICLREQLRAWRALAKSYSEQQRE